MPGAGLELAAASAVARSRLLERAIHDEGPWEILVNFRYPVEVRRAVLHDRVVFSGYAPGQSSRMRGVMIADLYCRGDLMSSRAFGHPGPGPYRLVFTIGAQLLEPAA